jgi:RimJ/RimL family protein N-acetyltransferase
MGEAWLLLGKHGYRHLVDLAHLTPLFLDRFRREHHLHRIQADVVATNEKAKSFVIHFGFKAEGLMRKYDVLGQDNIRFARIWEDDDGEPC